jgi:PhnB protein
MGSTLNPYLNFQDNAREALEFYRDVLGGELRISTFGDMGDPSAPGADLVMHGQLETPAGFTLMGSDAPPGTEADAVGGFAVSISGDDDAELRGYWDKLAEGGDVTVPFEKQMWGDTFGMVTDRFGVAWMVDIVGDPS